MDNYIPSDHYDNERVIEELEEFSKKLHTEITRLREILDTAPFHIQESADMWIDKIKSALGTKLEFTTDETIEGTIYLLTNHPDVHPRDEP
jgi:hypothetical protein